VLHGYLIATLLLDVSDPPLSRKLLTIHGGEATVF
jgi:hypothetical protein